MKPKPLIVVVGPTASGKSALAMQIAQKYNGEIIAADSRTIYRGMDIGTAKPTAQDQQAVRHHLIDIRNPNEPFSVAEFKHLAFEAIKDITSRSKLPILVGGTGLYVDAVIYDYQFGPAANAEEREQLNKLSIEELRALCLKKKIKLPENDKNKRHLVRAIELGGLLNQSKKLRGDTLVVGITSEKEKLRSRIEKRAQEMIQQGVLNEVAKIGTQYGWRGEALKSNIYRIFHNVVEKTTPLDVAIQELIQSDLALAKRQMTWFKRNKSIVWSENPRQLLKVVDTFLRQRS